MPHPNKDSRIAKAPDPLIVGRAARIIARDEDILGKSLYPELKR
jgi:hypothetical protein